MTDTTDIKQLIEQHITTLPPAVRNAIASSEVEQHLRALADKHKLHFDQWDYLEQEVMLTLIGVHPVEELELNIMGEVGIPLEAAHALASDINTTIFEPIRQELERQLEHPAAKEATLSETDTMRAQMLASSDETAPQAPPAAPAVQPATPPPPTPNIKVTRPSESTEYKPNQASHERKNVVDDPYREPLA